MEKVVLWGPGFSIKGHSPLCPTEWKLEEKMDMLTYFPPFLLYPVGSSHWPNPKQEGKEANVSRSPHRHNTGWRKVESGYAERMKDIQHSGSSCKPSLESWAHQPLSISLNTVML